MARHRNVRTMNYDEDYEGYDDVYGHSVEDDYCVSPSASSYMFDRSKQNPMSSFFPPGDDIEEEEEEGGDKKMEGARRRLESLTLETALVDLVPEEEMLLKSCLDEIRNVVGETVPDSLIISNILKHKFDAEKALDSVLRGTIAETEVEKSNKKAKMDMTPSPSTAKKVLKETTPSVLPPKVGSKLNVSSSIGTPRASVTVGFDLSGSNKDKNLSLPNSTNSSKAPSPIPITEETNLKTPTKGGVREFRPEAAVAEYAKERGNGKQLLNLLVIGHVDAGKSTLMGHLLWQLGQVSKKTMHKFETESKKMGKQSFVYAWVLDETGEERSRGITMDVGQSKFETSSKSVVLLDAPGHKDFIPNMITGAAQADVALLVVDATNGEFETGFESGGQTREHALLVRSLGVTQVTIAVNKLDTVDWSQFRFDEVRAKLLSFLVKNAGFRESEVRFVPCSGLQGDNLIKKSTEPKLNSWYNGPTLLEAIDTFKVPERPVGKPLRLTVNDVFRGPGGLTIGGRIETGICSNGDRVIIQPTGDIVTVKSVSVEEGEGGVGFAGDPVLVSLQGLSDSNVILSGYVLSDPYFPCRLSSKFQARVVNFEAMTIPLTRGFTGVMHLGPISEQVTVKKLISQLNKGTGEVVKLKPRFLGKNSNGIVEFEALRPICMEEFKDVKELGRFTLRSSGTTVAAGVITLIL